MGEYKKKEEKEGCEKSGENKNLSLRQSEFELSNLTDGPWAKRTDRKSLYKSFKINILSKATADDDKLNHLSLLQHKRRWTYK
jgi:hypothetical protein